MIGFFGVSIDASAEVFTVEKKSASDIVSLIGDTLPCTYDYNGVTYSTTFTYQGIVNANNAWRGLNIDDNQVFTSVSQIQDYDFIIYSAPSRVNYASFGKVHNVHIDCNMYFESYARGGFAMTSPVDMNSIMDSTNSIASYPLNYAGDFPAICGNTQASASLADYYGIVSGSLLNGNAWSWRPILYKIQSGGGFSGVYFDNVIASYDSTLYFGVWCPYVGGSMATAPPAETTTEPSTTTTQINVNVDVDMTETNGILGSIRDLISNLGSFIVNGIKGLFLPDADDITNWKQTIVTILNETFGGIPELENQLKDAISSIFSATARQTVTFKGIKVPAAAGQPEAIIVPEQEVALRPPGFDNLFSWAETFINIVATIAVANTCFNQVKRIVVGEVVIDAD